MSLSTIVKKNWKEIFSTAVTIGIILLLNYTLVELEKADKNSSIKTMTDAIWYMFVSLTTVGYGDMFPVTPFGKIIGYIYIIGSLGLLGLLIGKFSNTITDIKEKRKLGHYGTKYKNHVVIIGWNDFNHKVISQIVQANKSVAIVTNNKNDIELIKDLFKENVFALFADYENFEAFEKVNIKEASTLFVNFKEDSETLIYVIKFKKVYPTCNIVVLIDDANLKETFASAGVNKAVSKDGIASKMVASFIFEPDVGNYTEELMSTSASENECDIMEYMVTKKNPFLNCDCLDAFFKIKNDYNGIFLGLAKDKNGETELIKNPSAGTIIELNDHLIIMGTGKIKKRIEKDFDINEGRVS